jgi:protein-disulfide isomerase
MIALDVASMVAVLIAATAVVWTLVAPSSHERTSTEPIVPKEAVSIVGAPTLGSPQAIAAIIEFSDFQCPYCARFAQQILPTIKEQYVDKGLVLIAFRQYPLVDIHRGAMRAAQAADCAAKQGKFWALHDRLFADVRAVADMTAEGYANAVGVQATSFLACMHEAPGNVTRDIEQGRALHVTGTPTLMIGQLEDSTRVKVQRVMSGVPAVQDLRLVLDKLIGQKRPTSM